MFSFIYLAYQMMALLFEAVSVFLDTWMACLCDLARYRMAIEEEREPHAQWGGVAAAWVKLLPVASGLSFFYGPVVQARPMTSLMAAGPGKAARILGPAL